MVPAGSLPPMPEPTYDERRTSFGAAAATYAAHRPGYPTAAVEWVLPEAAARVADVGAGTGALTRTLVGLGLEVEAVEPDAAMLQALAADLPGVTTHVAPAESMPLGDASVDAAFVAQAWHWLEAERAAAELARVVRPGGSLGILWNVRLLESGWTRALGDLIGGEDSMRAVRPVEAQDSAPLLLGAQWSAPERGEFAHAVEMTADSLVALVGTYSYVRLRDDAEDVLAQVRAIAQDHPDLAGRATFPMPYVTVVYRARRMTA